jgi:hypothetical protein
VRPLGFSFQAVIFDRQHACSSVIANRSGVLGLVDTALRARAKGSRSVISGCSP